MSQIAFTPLSTFAVEAILQLWRTGVVWDGNLVSKQGRDELVKQGLADRINGFNFLTKEGILLVSETHGHEKR